MAYTVLFYWIDFLNAPATPANDTDYSFHIKAVTLERVKTDHFTIITGISLKVQ